MRTLYATMAFIFTPARCINGGTEHKGDIIRGGSADTLATPLSSGGSFDLRICNAYGRGENLSVDDPSRRPLVTEPIAFKQCQDHQVALTDGDSLRFQAGDRDVGAFSVKHLPAAGSSLLLVARRKDRNATAAAFSSHIFARSQVPQIAVVNAFQGADSVAIQKKDGGSGATQREMLRFNTVVAVKPGQYQVGLVGADGGAGAGAGASSLLDFSARDNTNYVVMRVGHEDEQAGGEIVVYPQTRSGTAKALAPLAAALLLGLRAAVLGN